MKGLWIVVLILSIGACAFLGWKISEKQKGGPKKLKALPRTEVSSVIEELQKVDPKLIVRSEAARYSTGLRELRGLAVGPEDRIYAVGDKTLGPINAAVDVCNVVSLHSGLPISVVDLAKAQPPFRVAIARAGASYVFNASGQTIDLEGLLCLFDADGPCGNAVKDAQRTKTDAATRQTLTVIWGSNELGDRSRRAEAWYRELLAKMPAATEDVKMV